MLLLSDLSKWINSYYIYNIKQYKKIKRHESLKNLMKTETYVNVSTVRKKKRKGTFVGAQDKHESLSMEQFSLLNLKKAEI